MSAKKTMVSMRMKKLREDALVGCDDKVEREKRRRKGPQNVCVTL